MYDFLTNMKPVATFPSYFIGPPKRKIIVKKCTKWNETFVPKEILAYCSPLAMSASLVQRTEPTYRKSLFNAAARMSQLGPDLFWTNKVKQNWSNFLAQSFALSCDTLIGNYTQASRKIVCGLFRSVPL